MIDQMQYTKGDGRGAKVGFILHLSCFVGVIAMLAVINFTYTPDHLWFVYPLIAWGIGLAAHGVPVFILRGKPRVKGDGRGAKVGFILHLSCFVGVMAMLAVVNFTYTPNHLWFVYPLIAWGIAVTTHGVPVFMLREKPAVDAP